MVQGVSSHIFILLLIIIFLFRQEFSVRLVRNTIDGSSRSLEIGPKVVMRLLLMKVDCSSILVKFIEPKLVGVVLRSKHVYKNNKRWGHAMQHSLYNSAKVAITYYYKMHLYSCNNVPKRRHPGSLRVLIAFSSISFTNSSMRSACISAWTNTAKGLLAFNDMARAAKLVVALGATKAEALRTVTASNVDLMRRFMMMMCRVDGVRLYVAMLL